ncbi:MAG: hypothetical protein ACFFBD_04045 [Candidatus Hodarchaeota archaeon]
MNQSQKVFVPDLKMTSSCRACRACLRSCPAEAIGWEGGAPIFDINKCVAYQRIHSEEEEECLECIMSCRMNILRLKPISIS